MSDCDFEAEEVAKGLGLAISHAIYVRSSGTECTMSDLFISPNARFLDLVALILAESLVPYVSRGSCSASDRC